MAKTCYAPVMPGKNTKKSTPRRQHHFMVWIMYGGTDCAVRPQPPTELIFLGFSLYISVTLSFFLFVSITL